jgi:hypothetical protein
MHLFFFLFNFMLSQRLIVKGCKLTCNRPCLIIVNLIHQSDIYKIDSILYVKVCYVRIIVFQVNFYYSSIFMTSSRNLNKYAIFGLRAEIKKIHFIHFVDFIFLTDFLIDFPTNFYENVIFS